MCSRISSDIEVATITAKDSNLEIMEMDAVQINKFNNLLRDPNGSLNIEL